MENKYQEAKDYAIGLIESNCHYTAPEVIDVISRDLQELIDKATPKKVIERKEPIIGTDKYITRYQCPTCGFCGLDPIEDAYYQEAVDIEIKYTYCKCGQALGWSKDE